MDKRVVKSWQCEWCGEAMGGQQWVLWGPYRFKAEARPMVMEPMLVHKTCMWEVVLRANTAGWLLASVPAAEAPLALPEAPVDYVFIPAASFTYEKLLGPFGALKGPGVCPSTGGEATGGKD